MVRLGFAIKLVPIFWQLFACFGAESTVGILKKKIFAMDQSLSQDIKLLRQEIEQNSKDLQQLILSLTKQEKLHHVIEDGGQKLESKEISDKRKKLEQVERRIKRGFAEEKAFSRQLLQGMNKEINRFSKEINSLSIVMDEFRAELTKKFDDLKSVFVNEISAFIDEIVTETLAPYLQASVNSVADRVTTTTNQCVSGIESLSQKIEETCNINITLSTISQELAEISDMSSVQINETSHINITLSTISQDLEELSGTSSVQLKQLKDIVEEQMSINVKKLKFIEQKVRNIEEKYTHGNVRIVNITETNRTFGGRLEVFYSDKWGSICDQDFGMSDAQVACRSMGFGSASDFIGSAKFGIGQNDILMEKVACTGEENSLFSCDRIGAGKNGTKSCDRLANVGVICNKVRLANIKEMDNRIGGRIEVFHSWRWGSVCDRDFDMNDATVACLSMGYSGASEIKYNAYFGQGKDDILLDRLSCTGEETSLFSCDQKETKHHDLERCSHQDDVGVICYRNNVRLANVTETDTTKGGRLEVFYSGRWGTVCDDSFSLIDANVACKSLGLSGASAVKDNAFFGRGVNDTWMDDVACTGVENSLFSCNRIGAGRGGSEDCDHSEDVGIVCNKTVVRLANIHETDNTIGGRVEVFYSGAWGTICGNGFDIRDAKVVCKSLGFSSFDTFKDGAYFGQGEGPIWIKNARCDGNEASLFSCDRIGAGRGGLVNCEHSSDVGVICNKVRLVNTTDTYQTFGGRLEVFYSGQWGAVCDDNFDMNDANVACKSIGFPSASDFKTDAYFGKGVNAVLMDNTECTGTESTLFTCDRNGAGRSGLVDCSNADNVGVLCNKTLVRLSNISQTLETISGRLEVFYSGRWGTVCDDDFGLNDAKVACLSMGYGAALDFKGFAYFGQGSSDIWMDNLACTGTETSLFTCNRIGAGRGGTGNCEHMEDVGVVCDKTNVRLANSTETHDTVGGRLEVFFGRNWTTVCEDGFGKNEADVACRSLGFSTVSGIMSGAFFGQGETNKWMDEIRCNGNENSLLECERVRAISGEVINCDQSNNVGLTCNKTLRLTNITETENMIAGRLEVFYSGQWGTVCDDYFDLNDSNVACRSMGFGNAIDFKDKAYFGLGSGNIWMDNMKCAGEETSLFSCDRIGAGRAGSLDCGHSEDVGVICNKVRLVNIKKTDSTIGGRLEVFYSGQWGTVCDDYFDLNDTFVACTSLGFDGASAFKGGAYFGPGTGNTWMDDLACSGDESSLFECNRIGAGRNGTENCGHNEDVGVICNY